MGLFRRAVKKVVHEPLHSPFPNSINRMASYTGPVQKLNESRLPRSSILTAAIVNFIVNIKVKYPRTTLIDAYSLIQIWPQSVDPDAQDGNHDDDWLQLERITRFQKSVLVVLAARAQTSSSAAAALPV